MSNTYSRAWLLHCWQKSKRDCPATCSENHANEVAFCDRARPSISPSVPGSSVPGDIQLVYCEQYWSCGPPLSVFSLKMQRQLHTLGSSASAFPLVVRKHSGLGPQPRSVLDQERCSLCSKASSSALVSRQRQGAEQTASNYCLHAEDVIEHDFIKCRAVGPSRQPLSSILRARSHVTAPDFLSAADLWRWSRRQNSTQKLRAISEPQWTPALGELAEGLETPVQAIYLATLLGFLVVGAYLVVRQVLIRRELEEAAKVLGDRIRTGSASSEVRSLFLAFSTQEQCTVPIAGD